LNKFKKKGVKELRAHLSIEEFPGLVAFDFEGPELVDVL
jgi:hypothetical protein